MNDQTPTTNAQVQLIDIGEEQAGQRIDNFLIRILKGAPKTLVYRILRKGEVRVNKGRIKPTYRLQSGDIVRVPPVRLSASQNIPPGQKALQRVQASIIHEDDVLLILNKPSGIAVHGGSGVNYGIIEALRVLRPDAPFLELVHRLDRDTSGCLIIAKRRSALRNLHDQMRAHRMDKRYLALVKGQWNGGERRIDAKLRKFTLKSGENVVKVSDDGKESLSLFRAVKVYTGASLLTVKLITGRTHQVRVHAASLGMPLAGDEKYGDTGFNSAMEKLGLRRLFLHAEQLSFEHPKTAEHFTISAPLNDDLQQVLENLEAV
ncbi:MAG: 23S rRNA pseudouridine(955/2504/2580) synthase RluC [Gammaproteobacteria bacterium]|nr:23S rRNA pseudouridine(955/2504/2580) synthase RluC [Gammaproteobacteria bacterium]